MQEKLVDLAAQGLMLVIVSKNEASDVEELFKVRDDFPLKLAHICDWRVSWQDKRKSITEAANKLRIAHDAFVLVDDNLGELTAVGAAAPSIRLIYAGVSPEATHAALEFYPGLARGPVTRTDALRTGDQKANEQREALASRISDPREYLRSLGVEIKLAMNPAAERKRLAEMCHKTNQFNLSISRLDEIRIDSYLVRPDRRVVMVSMKDRLADSGSVASIFFRRDEDALAIDELCVSCRAMGRHMEDIMIAAAIEGVINELPASNVRFPYAVGPRNQPARTWLAAFASASLREDEGGVVELKWERARYREMLSSAPVAIKWSEA